jgi:hypothetical protein
VFCLEPRAPFFFGRRAIVLRQFDPFLQLRPVFCFKAASEFWYMLRLGWTSYEDETRRFFVAGMIVSGAAV